MGGGGNFSQFWTQIGSWSCEYYEASGKSTCTNILHEKTQRGAQWLSGRVLDLKPKGHGFEPDRRHCVVVLEQDTFIQA